MLKQARAITLIALIITIIVMLILAGVAINMTLGSDGIIAKAQAAANTYQNAQGKEEYELAIASEMISGNRGTVTLTEAQYKSLTDRLDALESNAIRYPDYSRLLTQLTGNPTEGWNVPDGLLPWETSNNAKTWTATEDCFLVASLTSYYGASPIIYVDNEAIANIGDAAGNDRPNESRYNTFGIFNIFVKRGSVVSTRDIAGANPRTCNYNIRIYGLQSLTD